MTDTHIPRIEIDWIDITGHGGWHNLDDVRDLPSCDATTMGYLISRTNKDYRVACTLTKDRCGDIWIIPRASITDVRILKENNFL